MARTWLVAHDFSPLARKAMAYGASLLEGLGGGRLLLVHVRKPHGPSFGIDGMPIAPDFGDVEEEILAVLRRDLAAEAATVHGHDITVDMRIENGDPGDVIASIVADEDIDQIVIGSHGRRGLGRLFIGSVAEQVLRQSPVPVLVVKP